MGLLLMTSRRQFFKLACLAFIQPLRRIDAFKEDLPKEIRIFDIGKYNATIIIDSQASKQVRDLATLLAKYFQLSTGVAISVSEKHAEGKPIRIHVGPSDYVNRQVQHLGELDGDGFIIDFPDRHNIVIVGPTELGTEFGVYEFLERYLGVRWLLPGPDGEYVPTHRVVDIPTQAIRQEPVFFSRLLSGLRGEVQSTWARRNRMHGRIQFGHNLINLFPPEKYTRTHPEFFPIREGKRYLPPDNKTHGWQPCFSATGIAEEAIKNIGDYFAQHPEATSYSLGVNDGLGYCECDKCLAKISDRRNFLGYRDSSDVYFTWANRVVEGVLKRYPDKWFGCIAYREVAQPPSSTTVHPRIIPYMTYDRMKWIDSAIETEGKRMTEWWKTKCFILGWYDYVYGTPYCLPRIYFHKMADYYRYGNMHGVRAMYAEAYPNWGEGPKLYVALKLQWNPVLDVDSLLKDWYEKAVGKEASPYLEAYYKIWEKFWTQTILKSTWFTSSRGEYLPFHLPPSYLKMITDEIARSRDLLELVVSKTKMPDQRARATIIFRAFEYWEASAISYLELKEEGSKLLDAKNTRSGGGEARKEHLKKIKEKRLTLIDEFQNDPILIHPLRFDRYKGLQW
jgi:hypothetical protein